MAIQHHPLSNPLLGDFIGFEHSGKATFFQYTNGTVSLSCPDNTAFKWHTRLHSETEETIFPNALHYDTARVNPGLDQHSVDGMDDMAFGTELGFSTRSVADEAGINNQVEE